MPPWILPIFGFLIGSVPFGLLIAKARGVDIREHGSGNIGATNVFRVLGKGAGIGCMILDILKGLIPVILAVNLVRLDGRSPVMEMGFLSGLANTYPADKQLYVQLIHVLTGMAAIVGHNYSPWIGFKGGKGIATTGGVIIGLMPFGAVIVLLVFAVVTFTSRYVSVGSITAAVALPVMTHLGARYHHVDNDKANPTLWEAGTWNKPLMAFALLACILAIWKHRGNVQRLMNGTESRIFSKKTPS